MEESHHWDILAAVFERRWQAAPLLCLGPHHDHGPVILSTVQTELPLPRCAHRVETGQAQDRGRGLTCKLCT